jgi:parallel beta-helix repeat protein
LIARRHLAAAGSVLLLSLGIAAVPGTAYAAHVGCGQSIVANTVLDSDIGPCSTGISIDADNVTLDLNSFTISGNVAPGEDAGITVNGHSGVTIKNGTVTLFDAGVALLGGSGNTVHNMQVVNNRATGATFGDGIVMVESSHNVITGNKARNNGPYDGIGTIGGTFNLIDGNQITDNNQSAGNTAGIRLENGPASNDNTVTNNLVTNSGTFGIQVFAGGSRNIIKSNQVLTSPLDGIVVFAGGNDNVIEGNTVRSNRGSGISIRGAAGNFPAPQRNQILRNFSFGNAVFDLRDFQANCGTNQWHGNQAGTGSPPCTLNP